jgi:hypothetical protein
MVVEKIKDDESWNKELWKKYETFKKNLEMSRDINMAFHETVLSIMEKKNFDKADIMQRAELSADTVNRFMSGKLKSGSEEESYVPSMESLVAFCIGCNLDMLMTTTLLDSLSLGFVRRKKEHYAYCYLIENHSGDSMEKCNNVLRKLKVDDKHLLRENSRNK